MSKTPQLRRSQASGYESRVALRPGDFNIPEMLRDDADEIEELVIENRELKKAAYAYLHSSGGPRCNAFSHRLQELIGDSLSRRERSRSQDSPVWPFCECAEPCMACKQADNQNQTSGG